MLVFVLVCCTCVVLVAIYSLCVYLFFVCFILTVVACLLVLWLVYLYLFFVSFMCVWGVCYGSCFAFVNIVDFGVVIYCCYYLLFTFDIVSVSWVTRLMVTF